MKGIREKCLDVEYFVLAYSCIVILFTQKLAFAVSNLLLKMVLCYKFGDFALKGLDALIALNSVCLCCYFDYENQLILFWDPYPFNFPVSVS